MRSSRVAFGVRGGEHRRHVGMELGKTRECNVCTCSINGIGDIDSQLQELSERVAESKLRSLFAGSVCYRQLEIVFAVGISCESIISFERMINMLEHYTELGR